MFANRRELGIIDDISVRARVSPGLYIIAGNKGVGKTTVLREIFSRVAQNDFVALVTAAPRTDIMEEIAAAIGARRKKNQAEGDVLRSLATMHKSGMNIIILIDNAETMTSGQAIAAASLAETMPYARIVMAGGTGIGKIISRHPIFGRVLVRKYRLRGLSFIDGIRYIRRLSIEAASLSQYKNAIGIIPAFMLSFVSNRNMRNINHITAEALKDTARDGRKSMGVTNVMRAVRAHFGMVKENLYYKAQKIFVGLLVLLSLYYVGKILYDRFSMIRMIEVHRSVREQERQIQVEEP